MAQSISSPALWRWLTLALVIVGLDQLTKYVIVQQFQLGDSRTVTSFFNIVRWHNTGAAFSFLAGAAGWQRWFFVALGTAASVFIVWMLKKHPAQTLFCFAITLILGGAVGNVIDRMVYGHVVDFIQVHWNNRWYFPSFNIADSAITVGAASLILDEIRRVRRAK